MSVEKLLNRTSQLGAGTALTLAVVLGALGVISFPVALAQAIAAGGLVLWWVGGWGLHASLACAICLLPMAALGGPGSAEWAPTWLRMESWLGALGAAMVASSLLCLRLRRRSWFNPSVWLGAGLAALAILVLLSAAIGHGSVRSNSGAVVAMLIGISLTLARMGPGFLGLIERRSPAGYIGRWMLVFVIVVPAGLHMLQLKWRPPAGPDATVALILSSFVWTIALLGALMFALRKLDMMESVKAEAQAERDRLMERLQEEAAGLQQVVANRTEELASALKASLRFDYLARTTTNGVIIMNAEERIEWVNRAWEKFSGYTLDEVTGRRPSEFLFGRDTDPGVRGHFRRAMDAREPHTGELLNYRKDGQPFWVQVEIQPMHDSVGKVEHFLAIVTDITGRKLEEEQQRRLNERLGLALKALDCGIWDYDVVNDLREWDSRQCEIYGVGPDGVPGSVEKFMEFVHPDDRGIVLEANAKAAQGSPAIHYTYRIVRPDGAVRHITSHGTARRDEAGRLIRIVGLDRDVTEAMELREQLRVAEERWQLALAGTNDGVWDTDLETGRTFHDKRWAEIVGCTQEEILKEKDPWLSRIHPDDRQRAVAARTAHLANETPFYSCEFRLRHADGRWVWVLSRGRVVARDAAGKALRITGTHSDIGDRKALEDQLRKSEALMLQLGELANIGAWEIDMTTQQITWSPEIYRIHEVELGYMPQFKKSLDFYPETARRVLVGAFSSATNDGTPFDLELPFVTARGKKLWVRIKGRADGGGNRQRIYGVFQDITVRREAEEMRRQLEGQLFQAQKMETLGTLAGGIAHDFNNLLTGILGYQDLALDSLEPNHPSRVDLAAAREASMRARELVDQILTFSRQAGSEKVAVDIAQVIEDARRFLRATLPSTIGIEVQVEQGCEPVRADATQIYQVILNLGSNAAHAMQQTGGIMRITARPAGPADTTRSTDGGQRARFVRIDFSDTGHGMSEETRKRIFDPFFTTKDVGQGTGLGLSVAHGIIKAHHGTITVESDEGAGTTFTIHLPVAENAAATPASDADTIPRGLGERVAIVDDEDIVRSFSQLALERIGYKIEAYEKPADFLAEFQSRPGDFACLLTDQTMPGMRGIDLAMEVRKIVPKLPVIIMSGYFSRISPETLAQLGHVELLSKPFTNEELGRVVKRTLHPEDSET